MRDLTGFAEACYNTNSITELRDALQSGWIDATDCKTWGISADEWRACIAQAIDAKKQEMQQ